MSLPFFFVSFFGKFGILCDSHIVYFSVFVSWLLLYSRTTIPIFLSHYQPPPLSQRMKSQTGQIRRRWKQNNCCVHDMRILCASFFVSMYWNWFAKRRNFLEVKCFIFAIWSLNLCGMVCSSLVFALYWNWFALAWKCVFNGKRLSFSFEFLLVSLVVFGLFSLRTSGESLHLEYLFWFFFLPSHPFDPPFDIMRDSILL